MSISRILGAVAATVLIATLLGPTAPASAASVDEQARQDLKVAIDRAHTDWRKSGGVVKSRYRYAGDLESWINRRWAGPGSPVRIAESGFRGRPDKTVIRTSRKKVVKVPAIVRTALKRHQVAPRPRWLDRSKASTARKYKAFTRFDLVTAAGWLPTLTSLTATDEGDGRVVYRGTTTDPLPDADARFTIVTVDGRLRSWKTSVIDGDARRATRQTFTFTGAKVRLPATQTVNSRAVRLERQMTTLAGRLAHDVNDSGRPVVAELHRFKRYPNVTVRRTARGVVLTRTGFRPRHPLRWKVIEVDGVAVASPVRT